MGSPSIPSVPNEDLLKKKKERAASLSQELRRRFLEGLLSARKTKGDAKPK